MKTKLCSLNYWLIVFIGWAVFNGVADCAECAQRAQVKIRSTLKELVTVWYMDCQQGGPIAKPLQPNETLEITAEAGQGDKSRIRVNRGSSPEAIYIHDDLNPGKLSIECKEDRDGRPQCYPIK